MILRSSNVKLNRTARYLCSRPFSSTEIVRTKDRFKVLFCGSDDFSVASLKALIKAEDLWESIHVITPDETKVGRGGRKLGDSQKTLNTPPLLAFARDNQLSSTTMRYLTQIKEKSHVSTQGTETSSIAKPDLEWLPPEPFTQLHSSHLLLTASFGYILPTSVLELFDPAKRLNVHPSLLPRYRGAAPIQWTIVNGDCETGVTVQRLVEKGKGIDAGEIVGQTGGIALPEDATFASLMPRLADIGGELLVKSLQEIRDGTSEPVPQDNDLRTRAPKISKETAHVRWTSQSAVKLDRLHRGIGYHNPLWTELDGIPIQFIDPKLVPSDSIPAALSAENKDRTEDHNPGTAWLEKAPKGSSDRLLIACIPEDVESDHLHSWLQVLMIKPAGKPAMPVRDYWNGLGKVERARNWVQFK